MRFENSDREIECLGCCPECTVTTATHCGHCLQHGRTFAVHLPNGCDYSHLVGSPVKQHDKRYEAAQFDGLLTDYDRILLRFGMHIL